jgi:uroporphyrinogen-III synthase
MARKILVLVSESIDADALRSALGDDVAADDEVLVVAPALNERSRFFLADPDPAIERAQAVQEETAARLEEQGVDAVPAVTPGEEDPLQALEDALATYDADEIVLFTHSSGAQNWLEDGLVDEAQRRFDAPVRHLVVE